MQHRSFITIHCTYVACPTFALCSLKLVLAVAAASRCLSDCLSQTSPIITYQRRPHGDGFALRLLLLAIIYLYIRDVRRIRRWIGRTGGPTGRHAYRTTHVMPIAAVEADRVHWPSRPPARRRPPASLYLTRLLLDGPRTSTTTTTKLSVRWRQS